MALTRESVTTTASSYGTSYTFNMPSTRPDGDMFIVFIAKDDDQDITISGWTELASPSDAGTHRCYAFYRLGSSEPASYTTNTWTGTEPVQAWVVRYSDAGTPIASGANANSASCTAPALASASGEVIRFWTIEDDNAGSNTPSGHTDIITPTYFGVGSQDVFAALAVSDTAGDTTASTYGGTYFDNWAAITVAVPENTGGTAFADIRTDIRDGFVASTDETNGWNDSLTDIITVGNIVRTSSTVVTVTLAADATYNISAEEEITVTVPASAVTGGQAIVATPTFTVSEAQGGPTRQTYHYLTRMQ